MLLTTVHPVLQVVFDVILVLAFLLPFAWVLLMLACGWVWVRTHRQKRVGVNSR